MKTYSNLFESICSFENLLSAARKAQKGKRFRDNVGRFNANLENELIAIQSELLGKTYQPGRYRVFEIYRPKKRMISAAAYRDRVVHHALCNIIVPLIEKKFIFDSYSNRKGKGTHKAILRYQEFSRKNAFALKCDISKYFPSIDHGILKNEIRRTIACPDTLCLIERIIDNSNDQEPVNEYFRDDTLFTPFERRKGLPIGNLTSQFFANVYLNPLDHFVKETLKCKYYLRYVDDLVVLGNDKAKLWKILGNIQAFLELFRLRLHEHKCHIRKTEQGVTFLGFRIFPDYRLLKRVNIVQTRRRLRRLQQEYGDGRKSLEDMRRSVHGWLGHAKFGNTYRLRSKLFAKYSFCRTIE